MLQQCSTKAISSAHLQDLTHWFY